MSELPNVRRLNRGLEAIWRSGLTPRPKLESGSLQAIALKGRPIEAFGADLEWREPLDILTHSLRKEAELNPLGETMAHGQIVMALRARIRAQALWRSASVDSPFAAPIIILGQMRSGTTRLQRLLACDERLAYTRLFESLFPVPAFGRRFRAGAILSLLRRLNPELARIHPSGVLAPEEEFGLFSYAMGSAQFEAQWRVPSFTRYWEKADTGRLYSEFKRLLQIIAWSRKPKDRRRWVIKAPQFLQDLPNVLDAFPGAHLLWLGRDPIEVVPSSASLVWNQMRIQSDTVDPAWVGREWLRKTKLREQVATRTIGGGNRAHIVRYEAMNRDWRSEIRAIYDHIGLELTPRIEQRMADYLRTSRSHQGHRYSLAQFGLAERDLNSALDEGDDREKFQPDEAERSSRRPGGSA